MAGQDGGEGGAIKRYGGEGEKKRGKQANQNGLSTLELKKKKKKKPETHRGGHTQWKEQSGGQAAAVCQFDKLK